MSTIGANFNLNDVDTTQDDRETAWKRVMHGVEVSDLLEAVAEELSTTSEDTPLNYEAESLLSDLPDPDYGVLIRPSAAERVGRYILGILVAKYAATLDRQIERSADRDF